MTAVLILIVADIVIMSVALLGVQHMERR